MWAFSCRIHSQFGEKLRMPWFIESRLVKDNLGNRIGDHCSGVAACHVTHGAADRGNCSDRARWVRMSWLGRDGNADVDDRQGMRECRDGARRRCHGNWNVGRQCSTPPAQETRVGENVKWLQVELGPSSPSRQCNVRANSCWLTECQR